MNRHVARRRVDRLTVEIVVNEDYLLNTIEPCPSILVVWHVGRNTCSYIVLGY